MWSSPFNVASLESVRLVATINPARASALRLPIKTESGDLTEDLCSIPSRSVRRPRDARSRQAYDRSNARPLVKTHIPRELNERRFKADEDFVHRVISDADGSEQRVQNEGGKRGWEFSRPLISNWNKRSRSEKNVVSRSFEFLISDSKARLTGRVK